MSKEFDNNVLDLFKQKGIFSMSIWMVLKSLNKNLLAKKSSLTSKKTSDKEHERVLKAWSKFETKTMKNYHDLYLKCDILSLGDIFEKFRNNSLANYGICPSHHLRAPALGWNVMLYMLYMTKQWKTWEIELMSNL